MCSVVPGGRDGGGGGGKTSKVRQADSEFPVPIPWFPNMIKEQLE